MTKMDELSLTQQNEEIEDDSEGLDQDALSRLGIVDHDEPVSDTVAQHGTYRVLLDTSMYQTTTADIIVDNLTVTGDISVNGQITGSILDESRIRQLVEDIVEQKLDDMFSRLAWGDASEPNAQNFKSSVAQTVLDPIVEYNIEHVIKSYIERKLNTL